MKNSVIVSLVTFNTGKDDVLRVIKSIFSSKANCHFIIVDNSPDDRIKNYVQDIENVEYIFNNANLGFGAAHNIALKLSIERKVKYHFVVNPDVWFKEDVITPMVNYMNLNPEVGMMMPSILNSDSSVQNLPKLLPSPKSVILRKIRWPKNIYNEFITRYELRNRKKNTIYNVPVLSGCFTLFNVEALKQVGLYDDRFFMYFEDWDISRRIHSQYKTLYFPHASVFHGYESGANKNHKLFKIFIQSTIAYFNKWGWFFDKERKKINAKALSQLN